MIKKNKVIAALVLVSFIFFGAILAYKTYRKNHGVYAEVVKQDNGWGYKIYVEGKLVVNQYVMPAIPGNKPFPCEESAQKTADLVVEKVGRGGIPTLTIEEVNRILNESCK